MRHLLLSWNLTIAVVLAYAATGCASLNPSGPYQGDVLLYRMEVTVPAAYKTFDSFLKFEFDNRAALAQWPEVKKAADEIRTNAPGWLTEANEAHDQYVKAKATFVAAADAAAARSAAANLDASAAQAQKTIAVITAAVDIATRLIIEHQKKPTP
jgi:hypothetical protein